MRSVPYARDTAAIAGWYRRMIGQWVTDTLYVDRKVFPTSCRQHSAGSMQMCRAMQFDGDWTI